MQAVDEHSLRKAKILVERLARLSADSVWARRASGLRASLDKAAGQIEKGIMVDGDHFNDLVALGLFRVVDPSSAKAVAMMITRSMQNIPGLATALIFCGTTIAAPLRSIPS